MAGSQSQSNHILLCYLPGWCACLVPFVYFSIAMHRTSAIDNRSRLKAEIIRWTIVSLPYTHRYSHRSIDLNHIHSCLACDVSGMVWSMVLCRIVSYLAAFFVAIAARMGWRFDYEKYNETSVVLSVCHASIINTYANTHCNITRLYIQQTSYKFLREASSASISASRDSSRRFNEAKFASFNCSWERMVKVSTRDNIYAKRWKVAESKSQSGCVWLWELTH